MYRTHANALGTLTDTHDLAVQMASNFDCVLCETHVRRATHRVVLGAVTLYLCRDHAERYAGDADLRRWEAA